MARNPGSPRRMTQYVTACQFSKPFLSGAKWITGVSESGLTTTHLGGFILVRTGSHDQEKDPGCGGNPERDRRCDVTEANRTTSTKSPVQGYLSDPGHAKPSFSVLPVSDLGRTPLTFIASDKYSQQRRYRTVRKR
jgi:hypothetical protein